MSEPIIQSRLDTDFYKFTMGQFVFHRYRDVPVKYTAKNRTSSVRFADWIPESELRADLDHFMWLPWQNGEIEYLRSIEMKGKRIFADDYLEFLRNLKRLPSYNLKKAKDGQYDLEFPGPWSEAIYWETPAMAIQNELYYRALLNQKPKARILKEIVMENGRRRLLEKIKRLRKYPGAKIIEFGTRRRFGRLWQDEDVVKIFKEKLSPKQFIGTSNVYLARKYGLAPKGTMAHELFMAIAAMMSDIDEELLEAQNRVFDEWHEEYAPNLLIALTDTFGTDYTLSTITKERAARWDGFRPDSGDTLEIGQKIIDFLKINNIGRKELVPSDGLEDSSIITLHKAFRVNAGTTFGWGTGATNNLGFKPVSHVIKLTEANGKKTVKLSDNLAKATGTPEDIERYKRVFGHTSNFSEECKY